MLKSVVVALVFGLFITAVEATEFYHPPFQQPGLPASELPADRHLIIFNTTDHRAMVGVLQDFQRLYPDLAVTFHELNSLEIDQKIRGTQERADFVMSSAADLQLKLANDGFAQKVDIVPEFDLPEWASWRQEVYGLTLEPAVMIYHKPSFRHQDVPRNRSALIEYLAANQHGPAGIASYDITKSGLGYLFWTRDVRLYNGIWDLLRVMADHGLELKSSSSAIIRGVASGQYKIGYNVLGTYAVSALKEEPDLGVQLLEEYTTVLSRTAFIPVNAASTKNGRAFLSYLLSRRGQAQLSKAARLNALDPDVDPPSLVLPDPRHIAQGLRPVPLGTGLLVYLDQAKKQKIINRWQRLVAP